MAEEECNATVTFLLETPTARRVRLIGEGSSQKGGADATLFVSTNESWQSSIIGSQRRDESLRGGQPNGDGSASFNFPAFFGADVDDGKRKDETAWLWKADDAG
ncbi:hypothetical protein CMUS01_13369 [Colletotrichum musicola]|uniref:Uncharacterized protein n=1 Tax=Colletotrichum musicola TaxID=2175873 RepID=A0A8H6JD63_9PEZI|nr:hypothetical protein CMUS01_13369 [Colletotrichum musicola]